MSPPVILNQESFVGQNQVITYRCEDTRGNAATASRTVIVQDTSPPVVTLRGPSVVTRESCVGCQGTQLRPIMQTLCSNACTPYADPGADASDAFSGSLPVTTTGTVPSTNQPGTYLIRYTATDPNGRSTSIVRSVTIQDNNIPLIQITGQSNVLVTAVPTGTYNDPGAVCGDRTHGVLQVTTTSSPAVNLQVPGVYTITYSCSDPENGAAQQSAIPLTRTVTVFDTTLPQITLTGPSNVIHEGAVPWPYTYSATDDLDGNITDRVVLTPYAGVINVFAPLMALTTYNYVVDDTAGNRRAVTRVVSIVDTTRPVIYNVTNATLTRNVCHDINNPLCPLVALYTAYDSYSGDVTSRVTVTARLQNSATTIPVITASANGTTMTLRSPDSSVPVGGTYIVTFSCTDPAGNPAFPVVQTITITDNEPPRIALNGDQVFELEAGQNFADPGATATENAAPYNLTARIMNNASGSFVTGMVSASNVDSLQPPGSLIYIEYLVTDDMGLNDTVIRTIRIVDRTPPTITLTGPWRLRVNWEAGVPFVNQPILNFTASDPVYRTDLTSAVTWTVQITNYVLNEMSLQCAGVGARNISTAFLQNITNERFSNVSTVYGVGTVQVISYEVTDAAGNIGTASRTVTLVDTTPPEIALVGPADNVFQVGAGILDSTAWVVATDNLSGDISSCAAASIVISNETTVCRNMTTEVTNTSTDATTGNVTTTVMNVTTLSCSQEMENVTLPVCHNAACINSTLASLWATPPPLGEQAWVTYTIFDGGRSTSGRSASVMQTISYLDAIAPTLTVVGPTSVQVRANSRFTPPAVLCSDNVDSNSLLTSNYSQSSIDSVTNNERGEAAPVWFQYTCTDASGNSASQIVVVDVLPRANTSALASDPGDTEQITFTVDVTGVTNSRPNGAPYGNTANARPVVASYVDSAPGQNEALCLNTAVASGVISTGKRCSTTAPGNFGFTAVGTRGAIEISMAGVTVSFPNNVMVSGVNTAVTALRSAGIDVQPMNVKCPLRANSGATCFYTTNRLVTTPMLRSLALVPGVTHVFPAVWAESTAPPHQSFGGYLSFQRSPGGLGPTAPETVDTQCLWNSCYSEMETCAREAVCSAELSAFLAGRQPTNNGILQDVFACSDINCGTASGGGSRAQNANVTEATAAAILLKKGVAAHQIYCEANVCSFETDQSNIQSGQLNMNLDAQALSIYGIDAVMASEVAPADPVAGALYSENPNPAFQSTTAARAYFLERGVLPTSVEVDPVLQRYIFYRLDHASSNVHATLQNPSPPDIIMNAGPRVVGEQTVPAEGRLSIDSAFVSQEQLAYNLIDCGIVPSHLQCSWGKCEFRSRQQMSVDNLNIMFNDCLEQMNANWSSAGFDNRIRFQNISGLTQTPLIYDAIQSLTEAIVSEAGARFEQIDESDIEVNGNSITYNIAGTGAPGVSEAVQTSFQMIAPPDSTLADLYGYMNLTLTEAGMMPILRGESSLPGGPSGLPTVFTFVHSSPADVGMLRFYNATYISSNAIPVASAAEIVTSIDAARAAGQFDSLQRALTGTITRVVGSTSTMTSAPTMSPTASPTPGSESSKTSPLDVTGSTFSWGWLLIVAVICLIVVGLYVKCRGGTVGSAKIAERRKNGETPSFENPMYDGVEGQVDAGKFDGDVGRTGLVNPLYGGATIGIDPVYSESDTVDTETAYMDVGGNVEEESSEGDSDFDDQNAGGSEMYDDAAMHAAYDEADPTNLEGLYDDISDGEESDY